MAALIATLITVPLLSDLLTAGVAQERNPLAAMLLTVPLLAFAAKVAEIAALVAIVDICMPRHPRIGWFVVATAAIAGSIGAISNIA